MRNPIALVLLAGALLVGCGHIRPQYSTQQYEAALTLYLRGQSLDNIATSLELNDPREARQVIRHGLMALNHRYNNE